MFVRVLGSILLIVVFHACRGCGDESENWRRKDGKVVGLITVFSDIGDAGVAPNVLCSEHQVPLTIVVRADSFEVEAAVEEKGALLSTGEFIEDLDQGYPPWRYCPAVVRVDDGVALQRLVWTMDELIGHGLSGIVVQDLR